MKLNSLRHRLIALIALCLIAMLVLVTTQVFYVNRLIQVQTDTTSLLHLNNEILQLRRHEKDFMLRLDTQYSALFDQRANQIEAGLDQLADLFSSYSLPDSQLETIRNSFKQYREQFSNLVGLQLLIGVDESSGQQGQFRRNIHELEQILESEKLESLSLLLLQLRRHEKDFLQRLDLSYVELETQTYRQLRQELIVNDLSEQVLLLDDYHQGFATIVASYQKIGLTPDSGMQGDFRTAAHRLEQQLISISDILTPLIQQREQDVKVNGFIITSVTAVILLTLLVRNFVKLQNTLSLFLLFFHQSKRGYLTLDVKKMGYTEFETLATVANEMAETRKSMESELKKAQKDLAQLTSDDSD